MSYYPTHGIPGPYQGTQGPYQGPYQGSSPMYPQARAESPRTAINELDAFLSGLTAEERAGILASPDFAPLFGEFLNRFLFYLLQGDLGAAYITGSSSRMDAAETLKIVAHKLHAAGKESARTDVERLEKENRELLERVRNLEGGKA